MDFKPSPIFLTAITIIIILFAISIATTIQDTPDKPFSKIISAGPVWNSNTWICTSDKDFIVHGALRALEGAELSVNISGLGTQSLYSFEPGHMEAFTIGSPGGHTMTLTSTVTITGWITMQTTSDAMASCIQA